MPDSELLQERQHLIDSRAALKRMHDHTASMAFTGENTAMGGDHVSTQYLLQTLYRRMLSLRDDPTIPLFFGRIDTDRSLGADADAARYVGRRHVTAEIGGEPLVVDWRAPVALPFYQARPQDPMGVRLRRRFGFSNGELTAYEDEDLTGAATDDFHSTILESEIERPRTGPMRDIVATIQPEQDEIVRADLAMSLCVQGAPGTGKTAVGLHRAAFLLYAHRDQLRRSGVLVLGPNDNFLSYIGDVLPALGEIDARSETVTSLTSHHVGRQATADDPTPVAVLKGDARMAEVVHNAVWAGIGEAIEPLVVPRGSRQWRVPAYLVNEIVTELRTRGIRYESGRTMLPQRLADQVLRRMEAAGDSPDDRVQNAVARTAPVKQLCKQLWPSIDPAKLLWQLWSDPDLLATAADQILTPAEIELLASQRTARSARSQRWSPADVVLLDEIVDQLERTPSLGHVIIDEAQDLSAMELRAAGRRASTGSVTLLGDLAQATTAWASSSWADSLAHVGHPQARVEELRAGFRVPGAVIDYAARLLPVIAPGLLPPYSVRRTRGELDLREGGAPVWVSAVTEALRLEGTVAMIVPDAVLDRARTALTEQGLGFTDATTTATTDEGVPQDPDERFAERLELVPARLSKGLEFDHVVLVEPSGIVDGEADRVTGLRRLYVCLTRAVTSLVVVHEGPLPAELSD